MPAFNLHKAYSLIVTVQGGGCQAASGIDSVEGLSWGSREGEALPFLGAQIASVMNSQGYLPCANSWYQP
ncbi:MAG: hypothetical protein DWQ51_18085 [Microcystis wesenbergii TW10]|uniref:Uncharacterized protein n=1 Tax=Microcystis wesenbergii TW10 TaxID=2060474 RepID=A0A3E0LNI6_9CHRO|nr:MAG: hypothetical protein DWQ51_18085 [Microcystis wesenbergii TW10]